MSLVLSLVLSSRLLYFLSSFAIISSTCLLQQSSRLFGSFSTCHQNTELERKRTKLKNNRSNKESSEISRYLNSRAPATTNPQGTIYTAAWSRPIRNHPTNTSQWPLSLVIFIIWWDAFNIIHVTTDTTTHASRRVPVAWPTAPPIFSVQAKQSTSSLRVRASSGLSSTLLWFEL